MKVEFQKVIYIEVINSKRIVLNCIVLYLITCEA